MLLSCDEQTSTGPAPYEGARPLLFERVTQNFTPDIQWLGGRVMAVGANAGSRAALDSTLVWLTTATDNSISSYVTVGTNTDTSTILAFGGTPVDSLTSDSTYTFWLAEKSAFDARLDSADTVNVTVFTFSDTTMAMKLLVKGQVGGEGGSSNPIARISIRREETALTDRYIVTWTPDTARFRRVALREGPTGGFTDLLWHVVTPDSVEDNILPPIVIGESLPGTDEAVAWQADQFPGFNRGTVYILWMANRNWTGSFSPTATGYAWFRAVAF